MPLPLKIAQKLSLHKLKVMSHFASEQTLRGDSGVGGGEGAGALGVFQLD